MAIFVVPTTGVKPKSSFSASFPSNFEKIWSYAHALMAQGEHIEHLFMQNRWCLKIFPGVLVLTNRRAIFIRRGWLSTTFQDFYWRVFKDVQKEEHWSGSVLRFITVNNNMYQMFNLPQNEARGAYAFSQSIEEMAFEFRRWQRLEEERAAARGIALPAETILQQTSGASFAPQNASFPAPHAPPAVAQNCVGQEDVLQKAIMDLKRLRAEGFLGEKEYQNRLRILIDQF